MSRLFWLAVLWHGCLEKANFLYFLSLGSRAKLSVCSLFLLLCSPVRKSASFVFTWINNCLYPLAPLISTLEKNCFLLSLCSPDSWETASHLLTFHMIFCCFYVIIISVTVFLCVHHWLRICCLQFSLRRSKKCPLFGLSFEIFVADVNRAIVLCFVIKFTYNSIFLSTKNSVAVSFVGSEFAARLGVWNIFLRIISEFCMFPDWSPLIVFLCIWIENVGQKFLDRERSLLTLPTFFLWLWKRWIFVYLSEKKSVLLCIHRWINWLFRFQS